MSENKESAGRQVRFEQGDYLFKQGDASRDLYVVQSGLVRIFKTEGQVEVELDRVGSGGVVGEVAAIDGGTRSASGVAAEPTVALAISAQTFGQVLARVPEWFRKIATILVQRLREVDDKIHNTLGRDNLDHVAACIALISYSPLCAGEQQDEFDAKTLENELTDILHMPIAEVDEALRGLHKKGLIDVSRGKVVIKNREALEACGESVFGASTHTPAT
jgi:CRP/FNR family transcriptional regulator